MEALQAQIDQADALFEQVRREEQAQFDLIEVTEVVEAEPYRSLRAELRDIEELAGKIKERGQLVPILVWLRRGQYVLLSGHRRIAALRHLGEATVKAIVYGDRELSEKDALDVAIDDNVDRNSFSKVDLARLVARLVDSGLTQRAIARRLRLSNGSVSDYFRLATAPADVQGAVDGGLVALRAGLRLADEPAEARAAVLEHGKDGMLSLGDVTRLIETRQPPAPRRRSRRGAAWSRESQVVAGLAWQRQRGGDRELRVRLPAAPTAEQRLALRKLLLDKVREL